MLRWRRSSRFAPREYGSFEQHVDDAVGAVRSELAARDAALDGRLADQIGGIRAELGEREAGITQRLDDVVGAIRADLGEQEARLGLQLQSQWEETATLRARLDELQGAAADRTAWERPPRGHARAASRGPGASHYRRGDGSEARSRGGHRRGSRRARLPRSANRRDVLLASVRCADGTRSGRAPRRERGSTRGSSRRRRRGGTRCRRGSVRAAGRPCRRRCRPSRRAHTQLPIAWRHRSQRRSPSCKACAPTIWPQSSSPAPSSARGSTTTPSGRRSQPSRSSRRCATRSAASPPGSRSGTSRGSRPERSCAVSWSGWRRRSAGGWSASRSRSRRRI